MNSDITYTSYEDLEKIYRSRIQHEHSEEYEELTMEEKLLVDIDIEYLKDETNMIGLSIMSQYVLEKCLSKLRKRDRENGKRNGR